MTESNYWHDLPGDQQDRLRQVALRFRDLVPAIKADGTVPDKTAATTLLELLNIEAMLADEHIYWLQLSGDIFEAHADWLARTRRKFERHGWPWTTEELERRSRLWEVE